MEGSHSPYEDLGFVDHVLNKVYRSRPISRQDINDIQVINERNPDKYKITGRIKALMGLINTGQAIVEDLTPSHIEQPGNDTLNMVMSDRVSDVFDWEAEGGFSGGDD